MDTMVEEKRTHIFLSLTANFYAKTAFQVVYRSPPS